MVAFDLLITKVEQFVRRFYVNRLLRGGLLFLGITLASFLFLVNIEYFVFLKPSFKILLFFGFLAVVLGLLWFFILDPILKIYKVGKRLSYDDAGRMIGQLIPSINDKISNTLQLASQRDNELAMAAIDQKSEELKAYPFSTAIKLGENKKYLWFVLPVVGLFLLVWVLNPKIISLGSERLLNYNQTYLPEAPFDFFITSPLDPVEEGQDYQVEVELKGEKIPEKVYLQSNYGRFLMEKTAANSFAYVVPRLRGDLKFHIVAADFNSNTLEVPVFGSSALISLKAELVYPSYIGMQSEVVENPVSLSLPIGTKVNFSGVLKNGQKASFSFVDTTVNTKNDLRLSYRFLKSHSFDIKWKNSFSDAPMVASKSVEVIPDLYPTISLERNVDSTNERLLFFNGSIGDDYGLTALNFIVERKDKQGLSNILKFPIPKSLWRGGNFYHMMDLNELGLKAGESIAYYFEVFDNDGVSGNKRTSSERYIFEVPTENQLNEMRQNALSSAQSSMSDIKKEMERFQKSLDELRKANLNKNTERWKRQEMLDRLKQQQEQMRKQIQQEQQKLDETIKDQERFDEVDEELLQKQEELNKLMEELMDDELRELLEKMQELMDKNQQENLEELLKDFELTNEEMKNQLDRSMEMLKRMEVEEKLNKTIDELKELAKEQQELAEKNLGDESELQKELNEQFDSIQESLKEIMDKNEDLKNPMDLDMMNETQDQIQDNMKQSSEQLSKGNQSKASPQQKSAAQKMEQMAMSLQQQMDEQKKKDVGENMDDLRNLLFSLMDLSLDQEKLMLDMKNTPAQDRGFTLLTRKQRRIMDDFGLVQDSLLALAERVPQIGSLIDQELKVINLNYSSIVPHMHDRKLRDIGISQQYVMTSYNNLALMLNESLESMQQQMQSMSGGGGSCDKPGGKGSKPADALVNMKEQLKKQLEQMQKGQSPGQKPGDKNPGGQGAPGSSGQPMPIPGMNPQQISKMAAEQAMMRRRLEEMRNELNKGNGKNGNSLDELIDELDRQEKALVNQDSRELVKRQQEILTRLLESEKALMEREQEETRESKTANDAYERNLIRFDEYKRKKLAEVELLKLQIPGLNPYYKSMASAFYNRILVD